MKDFLERWGLWILLVCIFALYLLSRLLPASKRSPGSIFLRTREKAERIKEDTSKRLEQLVEETRSRRKELREIRGIEDEEERRRRFAELANRKEPP